MPIFLNTAEPSLILIISWAFLNLLRVSSVLCHPCHGQWLTQHYPCCPQIWLYYSDISLLTHPCCPNKLIYCWMLIHPYYYFTHKHLCPIQMRPECCFIKRCWSVGVQQVDSAESLLSLDVTMLLIHHCSWLTQQHHCCALMWVERLDIWGTDLLNSITTLPRCEYIA